MPKNDLVRRIDNLGTRATRTVSSGAGGTGSSVLQDHDHSNLPGQGGVLTGYAKSTHSHKIVDLTELLVDSTTINGLTVTVRSGNVKFDGAVTAVAETNLTLTASATNYIEVDSTGTVSANTTGFTAGRIPLATAVTDASQITSITDKRSLLVYETHDAEKIQGRSVTTSPPADGNVLKWDQSVGKIVWGTGSGGSGGGKGIAGAYDIEELPSGWTDAGIGDEFDSATLDPKWTVVAGTAGTVSLLATGTIGAIYDLSSRGSTLLIQTEDGQLVKLRQPAMGDGEQVLVSFAVPDMPDTANNSLWVGVSISNDSSDFNAGTYAHIYVDGASTSDVKLYDGLNIGVGKASALGARIYFRVARSGDDYHYFYSRDGIVWGYMGKKTITGASRYIWIFAGGFAAVSGFTGPYPVIAVNWVRHVNNLNLDPW